MTLEELLDTFAAQDRRLEVWENYPHVSPAEDDWTDAHACDYWSKLFAQFCNERGVAAFVVHGDDPEQDDAGHHYWVQVGEARVDWTARQFYNLEYPHNPKHANLPCPLVWQSEQHPIVTFNTITQEQA